MKVKYFIVSKIKGLMHTKFCVRDTGEEIN